MTAARKLFVSVEPCRVLSSRTAIVDARLGKSFDGTVRNDGARTPHPQHMVAGSSASRLPNWRGSYLPFRSVWETHVLICQNSWSLVYLFGYPMVRQMTQPGKLFWSAASFPFNCVNPKAVKLRSADRPPIRISFRRHFISFCSLVSGVQARCVARLRAMGA